MSEVLSLKVLSSPFLRVSYFKTSLYTRFQSIYEILTNAWLQSRINARTNLVELTYQKFQAFVLASSYASLVCGTRKVLRSLWSCASSILNSARLQDRLLQDITLPMVKSSGYLSLIWRVINPINICTRKFSTMAAKSHTYMHTSLFNLIYLEL